MGGLSGGSETLTNCRSREPKKDPVAGPRPLGPAPGRGRFADAQAALDQKGPLNHKAAITGNWWNSDFGLRFVELARSVSQ